MSNVAPTMAGSPSGARASYLDAGTGSGTWFFTLDHKRLGIMYLAGILAALVAGGLLAVVLRAEFWTPAESDESLLGVSVFHQLFTFHGLVMTFLFLLPGISATLGNFCLPIMLGARNMVFPRLNLLGFWCWIGGAALLIASVATGRLDLGWTLMLPYASTTSAAVLLALLAVLLLCASVILTGLNILATVHCRRADGLGWRQLPIFVWGLYSAALVQLLATPVFMAGLLVLLLDQSFGWGLFDPASGGNPLLFEHLFWFYAHPAIFTMVLPGIAVVSEVIAVHSRKRIFSYGSVAFCCLALAAVSFLGWGRHLVTVDPSGEMSVVFSLFACLGAVPALVILFCWVATLYKGRVNVNAGMLYALGFMWMFAVGIVSGLFQATLNTGLNLHDTLFDVAQSHYLIGGGTIWALLAGLHHWWPKLTGRMFHERLAFASSLTALVAFNLAFLPFYLMGLQGVPKRYHEVLEGDGFWQSTATFGTVVLMAALLVALLNLLASLRSKQAAPGNPWDAASLEWQAASPPSAQNFDEPPAARDPYDFA